MLPILQNQSESKMSLKEITDLIGVRHDKACLKVLSMAEEPEFGTVSITDIVYNDKGQTIQTYMLDKRQSVAVAAKLNTALLMRVIDRWQELESKQSVPQFNIPKTLPEALRLAADLADQLAIAAPKVAVYELLADRKGDVSTTIVAKELSTTAIKLNRFLRDNGIKWLNADLPKAGYETWFNVVADVKNGHEFTQCLITPAGQLSIAELWANK
jgi:phage antirepressor YoqD-like protein